MSSTHLPNYQHFFYVTHYYMLSNIGKNKKRHSSQMSESTTKGSDCPVHQYCASFFLNCHYKIVESPRVETAQNHLHRLRFTVF